MGIVRWAVRNVGVKRPLLLVECTLLVEIDQCTSFVELDWSSGFEFSLFCGIKYF